MPGRTLDQIIQEELGIKDMVILRLLFTIEDLKAQLEDERAKKPTAIVVGSRLVRPETP